MDNQRPEEQNNFLLDDVPLDRYMNVAAFDDEQDDDHFRSKVVRMEFSQLEHRDQLELTDVEIKIEKVETPIMDRLDGSSERRIKEEPEDDNDDPDIRSYMPLVRQNEHIGQENDLQREEQAPRIPEQNKSKKLRKLTYLKRQIERSIHKLTILRKELVLLHEKCNVLLRNDRVPSSHSPLTSSQLCEDTESDVSDVPYQELIDKYFEKLNKKIDDWHQKSSQNQQELQQLTQELKCKMQKWKKRIVMKQTINKALKKFIDRIPDPAKDNDPFRRLKLKVTPVEFFTAMCTMSPQNLDSDDSIDIEIISQQPSSDESDTEKRTKTKMSSTQLTETGSKAEHSKTPTHKRHRERDSKTGRFMSAVKRSKMDPQPGTSNSRHPTSSPPRKRRAKQMSSPRASSTPILQDQPKIREEKILSEQEKFYVSIYSDYQTQSSIGHPTSHEDPMHEDSYTYPPHHDN